MAAAPGNAAMVRPPERLSDLFLGFLSIGARAFGGVLPWAHRALVEERHWLSDEEFAEALALCQFLPGPNIANMSVVLGRRWFGFPGAIAAFLGLLALPFAWVLALAVLYADWSTLAPVRAVVAGVGIAGGGMFIATALKLGQPLARKPAAIALALACFVAVGLLRAPLLVVLPVAVLVALAAARRDMV